MHRSHLRLKTLRHRVWRRALVAFGANLGDRHSALLGALAQLQRQDVRIAGLSSLYTSLPMLPPSQHPNRPIAEPSAQTPPNDNYLNGVCMVHTQLGPRQLLRLLQKIELLLGRERRSFWGPRTIDLDLLCYDHWQMHQKYLMLPHPGIPFRPFVLAPLQDINAQHPWPHVAIAVNDLLQNCDLAACGIVHKQLSWLP